MPELAEATQSVIDFAQQPLTALAALPVTEDEFFQESRLRNLLELCNRASASSRSDVARALVPAIAVPDLFQGSRVAMLCGILVEWGADPTIAVQAILDRLPEQVVQASKVAPRIGGNDQQLFEEAPEQLKAWKGLPFMLRAAVTMLSRDRGSRQAARQNRPLAEALESLQCAPVEVDFFSRILGLADGVELLVLCPAQARGFRVLLEAVNTNFHLFTLLQDALVGASSAGLLAGAKRYPRVVAVAKNELYVEEDLYDTALWNYHDWTGLQPDGTLGANDLGSWIWGEMSPLDIPLFDGCRVVLLGPPAPECRSWNSGFFASIHEALRCKVQLLEVLGPGAVDSWLARIRQAPRPAAGSSVVPRPDR
ncbi:MAG: hypothetical protein HY815_01120 [Candidatus Riflebacteria bacterium]|nr:hypothetical protein [Candidatus Riflebacteria bacterium]